MGWKHFWPAWSWAAMILLISGLPGDLVNQKIDFLEWLRPDKIVHIILFGVLAVLILWGISKQYPYGKSRFRYIGAVLLVGTVFGVVTEALQRFVFVGRSGNIFDLAADFIGCLCGVIFFDYFLHDRYQKNS